MWITGLTIKWGSFMRNPFKIFGRGYDAGESSHVRKDLGYARRVPCDEDNMVNPDGSRELINMTAIDLRRNGADNGVCDRIAAFAIGSTGLRPQALTSDDNWNTLAEDWWNYDYSPACDSRQRVSMWQMQWQAVSLRPTMGGVYWQLMADGTMRPIETERIRQPASAEAKRGCRDGVKVDNATGRILGYYVHSRDDSGQFLTNKDGVFVKAENMIPVIRPPWRPDQVREIADFAAITNRVQDMHEANQHTLNTMKTQSKILAFLENVTGGAGINSGPRGTTTSAVGERKRFTVNGLEIMHLNANEKMNLSSSPTPGATHIPYMQMQAGLASAGIGYPYEFFTFDFSHCDFSRMIAVVELINNASALWRTGLAESLYKLWVWRIAMAINDGDLPPAPLNSKGISEWNLIDWQGPKDLVMDRQKDIQADTLEFQMRQGSMSGSARRRGKDYSDILRQQARDYKLEQRVAKEEGVPEDIMHPKAQIPGQTSNAGPIGQGEEKPEKKEGATDE
jgi:capsid protein